MRIVARERVAYDENVVALTFASGERRPASPLVRGVHLDVLLPSRRVRQYSLCGDPADQSVYRIAVRRIPGGGGGSIEIHDDLKVGDVLSIRGPRNAFPWCCPASPTAAATRRPSICGSWRGIGITPILPMLSHAERLGYDWSAIYTEAQSRFTAVLARIGALRRPDHRAHRRRGRPPRRRWPGRAAGRRAADRALLLRADPDDRPFAHLDGRRDLELHYERFSPPPVVGGSGSPSVWRATTCRRRSVPTRAFLAAIRRVYPGVPYSTCQQGFCGTSGGEGRRR